MEAYSRYQPGVGIQVENAANALNHGPGAAYLGKMPVGPIFHHHDCVPPRLNHDKASASKIS